MTPPRRGAPRAAPLGVAPRLPRGVPFSAAGVVPVGVARGVTFGVPRGVPRNDAPPPPPLAPYEARSWESIEPAAPPGVRASERASR